jgi:hypothetical protein
MIRFAFLTGATVVLCALWGCSGTPGTGRQHLSAQSMVPGSTEAPEPICSLQAQIRNKKPSEVAAIIVRKFGRPNRDVGSGLDILEWDISGGKLFLTVEGGPPTFCSSDGSTLWLAETQNSIGDNITSTFEMSTLPDPKFHGMRFALGELTLRPDGKYEYVRDQFSFNFFVGHPWGSYTISYPSGLSSQTLLENVPDNTCVATIHFLADQTPAAMDLKLCTSRDHRLYFVSADKSPLGYALEGFWCNVWGKSASLEWGYAFPEPLNWQN